MFGNFILNKDLNAVLKSCPHIKEFHSENTKTFLVGVKVISWVVNKISQC